MSLDATDIDIVDTLISKKGIEHVLTMNSMFDFKTVEFLSRKTAREKYIADKFPDEYIIWKLKNN